jgi:hypothetical protein
MISSWHYFDFISDEGTVVVLVFYNRPFFLSFDISLLDVVIYRDGKKEHFGYPVPTPESLISFPSLPVTISNSRIMAAGEDIIININEEKLKLNFKLQSRYKHWKPNMVPLYKSGDQFFNWQVLMPFARTTAEIDIRGEKISLIGQGYLDYNQGNIRFNHIINHWYWGRFHSPERSVVFGSLHFKNNQIYRPCFILNGNNSHFMMERLLEPADILGLEFNYFGKKEEFRLEKRTKIDDIRFLISKIPFGLKLLRKIHEFVFYRMDESNIGRRFSKILANVQYERTFANLYDSASEKYSGFLEYMKFE